MLKTFAYAVFVIGLIVLARLLPHTWNVAPVTALCLLVGARFPNRWQAWVLPLVGVVISDIYLGFYPEVWSVYLCYALFGLLGLALRKTNSPFYVAGSSLLCSVLFFVITNFACWLQLPVYTKDIAGLLLCFDGALPFFRSSLMSDLGFTCLFFALWEMVASAIPQWKMHRVTGLGASPA